MIAATEAFEYPIPWWASLALLFCLGVGYQLGVHASIQRIQARKARNDAEASGVREVTTLERLYKLKWEWLLASAVTSLAMATVSGAFIGKELLDTFYGGAGLCGVGALSVWAGPAVMDGVKRLLKKVGK